MQFSRKQSSSLLQATPSKDSYYIILWLQHAQELWCTMRCERNLGDIQLKSENTEHALIDFCEQLIGMSQNPGPVNTVHFPVHIKAGVLL